MHRRCIPPLAPVNWTPSNCSSNSARTCTPATLDYDATPLGAANYKDQRDVVEYLLQFARIWDAVKFGGLDRVRTLLRENPECVNVRDDEGRTPLHYPYKDTQHGEEIIELLIAHGADINAKDNAGRTPADQMLQNGRRDLAEVLRRHGGDSA